MYSLSMLFRGLAGLTKELLFGPDPFVPLLHIDGVLTIRNPLVCSSVDPLIALDVVIERAVGPIEDCLHGRVPEGGGRCTIFARVPSMQASVLLRLDDWRSQGYVPDTHAMFYAADGHSCLSNYVLRQAQIVSLDYDRRAMIANGYDRDVTNAVIGLSFEFVPRRAQIHRDSEVRIVVGA